MDMVRKKAKKEKNIIDHMQDTIDFRGLTQDEVVEQDGLTNIPRRKQRGMLVM